MKPFTKVILNSSLPRSFREIHLELAREKGHPSGDPATGYVLVVPLDDNSHIDADLWKNHRDACRVARIRPQVENAAGNILRRPGGTWAFRYDHGETDTPLLTEEVGYHFSNESFVPGEYVSIKERDGEHTYIVRTVRPLS